jgi:hypothetical protein
VATLLKLALTVVLSFHAPTHTPKVSTRWYYTVKVTQAGKPVRAKLTESIVDPIGNSHPVTYGTTSKKLVDWPFTGTFRDFILWPGSARGIPLRLKVVVAVGKTRKTATYAVTPRA